MKTSELTGAALDWAVAKCEGISTAEFIALQSLPETDAEWKYHYSTDWLQGGQILDRERMEFDFNEDDQVFHAYDGTHKGVGKTHLIAAMRCYVASKLGAEVDVPKELT